MGTLHNHNLPITDKNQLLGWLTQTLPQYTYGTRGPSVIMGAGSVTGLAVVPKGPGKIRTVWGMPNVGLQIMINLSFLAGLLPGVILILIIWSSVKGKVKSMEAEFAQALASGGAGAMPPGPLPPGPPPVGPPPGPPGPPPPGPAPLGPGSAVMVTASDGNEYPGTIAQAAQGQYLCSFPNGDQNWYPANAVRPA